MAKKTGGKVIQMLSPENYIRQKARTLPVFECMINTNWEESKFANVVVSRIHTNGNVTVGVYLVDLMCLGVKDTLFMFNETQTLYRERFERFFADEEIEKITYELAHNIIYAGIEFAEGFEFKPHKEFTSITQYILEEDSDDIPLIEIECGFDEKPAYMPGPDDNEAKTYRIIAQLERTAGEGNYYLFDTEGELINGFGDEDFEDEFSDMSFEEKGEEFLNGYSNIESMSEKEQIRFFDLLQSIVDYMVDVDQYNRFYDELLEDLTIEICDDEDIPYEMLGVEKGNLALTDEIKLQFLSVISLDNNLNEMKKQFNIFKKNKGFDAAIDFLDVVISGVEQSKDYEKKFEAAVSKHPDYALLQLRWNKKLLADAIQPDQLPNYPLTIKSAFPGRDSLHSWEYFNYVDILAHTIIAEKNFAKLDAFNTVLEEIEIDENVLMVIEGLIVSIEVELVVNYLNENLNK
jgi:hypothetical protein